MNYPMSKDYAKLKRLLDDGCTIFGFMKLVHPMAPAFIHKGNGYVEFNSFHYNKLHFPEESFEEFCVEHQLQFVDPTECERLQQRVEELERQLGVGTANYDPAKGKCF